MSWYFASASAVYNGSTTYTTITIKVVDNGSYTLSPSKMHNQVPLDSSGTRLSLVGTWTADYYSSSGTYLCTAGTGAGCSPDISNGGYVLVHMRVSGASPGDTLTTTYTFSANGQTVTHSCEYIVS